MELTQGTEDVPSVHGLGSSVHGSCRGLGRINTPPLQLRGGRSLPPKGRTPGGGPGAL